MQAQREKYLIQNPDKVNESDIRRSKIILHAIDVMDEYSQNNAEDMEVATEMAQEQICGLAQMAGTMLGTLAISIPAVRNSLNSLAIKNPKLGAAVMFIPSIVGAVVGTIASFPAIVMGTKMQISASRRGRFEAMQNDLKSPAVFALLNKEQLEKANKLVKDVELEDKDKKRIEKVQSMNLNPLESFKTLKKMWKGDAEFKAKKEEFDLNLTESEKHFEKTLSPDQITNAKRDQQLLAKIVNKLDIASQDYSENVELATNTLTAIAFAGGGLTGWVSKKLLKVLNLGSKMARQVIPWGVGLVVTFGTAIYAAQMQKQASRIGRFKAKQEFLNNPNSLIYVDDNEASKLKDVKAPEKAKKPNMFKFLAQVWNDNKEYKNYKKTALEETLKFQKALENIDLTEEQMQDAKNLQMNVFKTFNKVDEKSQTYSESVEAMGELAKQGIGFLGAIGITLAAISELGKVFSGKTPKNNFMIKYLSKVGLTIIAPLVAIVGLDVYVTKQQKKASRVADMLALKDLSDYRHYADYSKSPKTETQNESNLLAKYKH